VREYETVFILHPQVDDAGIEKEIEAIQQTIAAGQGEVTGVHKWGRRKLAYPIRKVNEGFYTLIRFKGEPPLLQELDRRFKLNESVLRHLTVHAVGDPTPPEPRPRDRRERGGRGGGRPPRGDFRPEPRRAPSEPRGAETQPPAERSEAPAPAREQSEPPQEKSAES